MKGTIVSAWIETCRNLYGDTITDETLRHYNISPDKIFRPSEDIDDKVARGIVEEIGKRSGKSSDQMWTDMGIDNVTTYTRIYPGFFKYKNLYSFLRAMFDIHVVVTKRVAGANPPILGIEPVDSHTAHMTYSSSRGMFSYFHGMLKGSAKHFAEDIKVDVIEKTKDFTKISIKFPEEIYLERKFRLNKILSLGFIKSIEGKVALVSGLLVGIPGAILPSFLDKAIYIPLIIILSIGVPLAVSKLLFKPLKSINNSLDSMIEKNLSIEEDISTNDFFQDLNDRINLLKASIKTDFVGYKGTTDELNEFADKFNDISDNMASTSLDISDVVEQVADGAIHQADETEQAAYKLHSSVDSLNSVVDRENQGKEDLEKVVIQINEGYEDLQNTSNSLNNMLIEFSKVKDKGRDLQNRANEVRDIVETVEKISEQTNLLALNASIEASRAGEFGQGFTVVATEIRKLAEDSGHAVQSINDNLASFVHNIDDFVLDIDKQYEILESENQKLDHVAKENYDSVTSISQVSDLIVALTNELTQETDSINTISNTIESLAAIAEENSASSQEVSANVHSYTEEIRKMTESIHEFKKVSMEFSQDLENYVI